MRKPSIDRREIIAKTRLFAVEALDLTFSNGEKRQYERLLGGAHGAVIMIAMPDPDTVLMVREYSAGTDRYELQLPKGRIEAGEALHTGANRELSEEVGMIGKRLTTLHELTISPGYMTHATHTVLIEELEACEAEGDEPEPLEVVPVKLSRLYEVANRDDCTEARSIAALYMARDFLASREQ